MARPVKQGIDYFPLDVDIENDDKLPMIIGEFGIKGEMIFIKLLAFIYKTEGYYIEWNEESQLKFANRVSYITGGPQVNLINEVVTRCVKWGLFHKPLFDSLNILTSKRIQQTWFEATRKRKNRVYDGNYWVISAFTPEETTKKTGESTQRKVKESKEKKSVYAHGINPELTLEHRRKIIYENLKPFIKNYGKPLLREFYDYWTKEVSDNVMLYETKQDFFLNVRLETWKKIEDRSKAQDEPKPKMKQL